MRLSFFHVPVLGSEGAAEVLNRFLSSHRVVHVERDFVADGPASFWAVCVTWTEGGPPEDHGGNTRKTGKGIDYREVLSVEEFALYDRLRKLRKEIADAEGLPPFAVFTNEQLAAMVQGRVEDAVGIRSIEGIGPGRVERFGNAFIEVLRQGLPALSREQV